MIGYDHILFPPNVATPKKVRYVIPGAQVLSLDSDPVTIVDSPGAQRIILPFSPITVLYRAGSVAFTDDPAVVLRAAGGSAVFASGTVGLDGTTPKMTMLNSDLVGSATDIAALAGYGIEIALDGPLPAAGTIETSAIGDAGANYEPGDVATLDAGTGDAQVTVETVDTGGEVLTYTVSNPGTSIPVGISTTPQIVKQQGPNASGLTIDVLTVVPNAINKGDLVVAFVYQVFEVTS